MSDKKNPSMTAHEAVVAEATHHHPELAKEKEIQVVECIWGYWVAAKHWVGNDAVRKRLLANDADPSQVKDQYPE